MARVTALCLRDRAREAMLAGGGRGFVRFLPEGGALLAMDAVRRCAGEAERRALFDALEAAGFVCKEENGLLLLAPGDALLEAIGHGGRQEIDWNSPLHPVKALGVRWAGKERRPLTPAGRQLIVEALRLTWRMEAPPEMAALRARAAVMQRQGEESGMHEAGAVLLEWCDAMQGGHTNEA